MPRRVYYWDPFVGPPVPAYRPYGCFSFLLDIFMTLLTCGLWIIWIIIREIRNSRW